DHVACAGRGEQQPLSCGKKATAPGGHHQLGAALATAVGIVAAHCVDFTIWPCPLAVFIAFVACDDNDGLHTADRATRFEQVHGSHHVGTICADWILIGRPH